MADAHGGFGVFVEAADGLHHLGLVLGDDDVDFLVVEDAFGTHAGGDDGLAQSHGFDDLDADTTTRKQRHDGYVMICDKLLGVRYLADHVDMRVFHGGKPFRHGTAGQMVDEVGHFFHCLG